MDFIAVGITSVDNGGGSLKGTERSECGKQRRGVMELHPSIMAHERCVRFLAHRVAIAVQNKVWEAFEQGKLAEIRNYCETDVVNTYLVYMRFQMMRGQLTRARYDKECELVRSTLSKSDESHWKEYLAAWPVGK